MISVDPRKPVVTILRKSQKPQRCNTLFFCACTVSSPTRSLEREASPLTPGPSPARGEGGDGLMVAWAPRPAMRSDLGYGISARWASGEKRRRSFHLRRRSVAPPFGGLSGKRARPVPRSRYNRGMSVEPKKRSRKWLWIAWALLAALVLYPLSMGPAYLWVAKATDPAAAMNLCNTMYAPLIWFGGAANGHRTQWTGTVVFGPVRTGTRCGPTELVPLCSRAFCCAERFRCAKPC